MSFLFRVGNLIDAQTLLGWRTSKRAGVVKNVSAEEAMRHSAVWACLRLRADLVSTSPVDCFRDVAGRAIEVPTPPVLVTPGGSRVDIVEWLYSSQVDLDRFGNSFGLITARDGNGLPARIDLLPGEQVTVRTKNGEITEYKVEGKTYDPMMIWHEKQYTVAGVPVGLAPLAAAALSVGTYLSAQEFARDWFSGRTIPGAWLKNTKKTLTNTESDAVKDRYKSSVQTGDPFVTGSDWDYTMSEVKASETEFINMMNYGGEDICRFLGVPADMIDCDTKSGSITYANITQRNLQLLIVNLGPAITRRERALSNLLPRPRYVKLNTDAVVLRMDPRSRAEYNQILLESRQRAPSEVREKDDLPPFTPEQIAEINALLAPAKQLPQVTKAQEVPA